MDNQAETRTPNLTDLAQLLELRWRMLLLADSAVNALILGLVVSTLLVVASIAFPGLPLAVLIVSVQGAALVTAITFTAVRHRDPVHFLADADRSYELKALLSSGFTFGQPGSSTADNLRAGFESIVVRNAEAQTDDVDPKVVYPFRAPPRAGLLAALAVVFGIMVVLNASGWFDPPVPPYLDLAYELEDLGERLAERAGDDETLEDLANELMRLGEDARNGTLDEAEGRRRISELGERVEERVANLQRTPPIDYDEDAQVPPEAAETVRSALQSGMGEGDITEMFMRMRSEGNTIPDIVDALEEASPDMAPNANIPVDEERVQELLDQLNNRPPEEPGTQSDIVNDLNESQRVLQQMGSGLSELSQGEEESVGTAEESGVAGGGGPGDDSATPPSEDAGGDEELAGQQGGTLEVQDTFDDDFTRSEAASPVLREIQGVVTENTVLDILIRELPDEATSTLTEQERDVIFNQVIEEAVNREQTPPELQNLVRNYFLRLTLANEEGTDE